MVPCESRGLTPHSTSTAARAGSTKVGSRHSGGGAFAKTSSGARVWRCGVTGRRRPAQPAPTAASRESQRTGRRTLARRPRLLLAVVVVVPVDVGPVLAQDPLEVGSVHPRL